MREQEPKTAIITGAAGGMGYDMVKGFVSQGYNVVMTGRDSAKLEAAVQRLGGGANVTALAGDIGIKETGEKLVALAKDRFGGVDVLVNNAGIFYPKPFLDSSESDLEAFFHINLKGTYLTSQAVARQMIDQGQGGAIINIGTVLVQHGVVCFPVSAAMASKGGIHAITVSLATELAQHRIRVNTIAPGVIRTPLHASVNVDDYAGLHPLKRVGEVSETTDAVLYLAKASYSTGTIMAVDGGYLAGRL